MKKRLRDIADFRVGYQFRGKVKPDPTGPVPVIQIKDVNAVRQIDLAGLARVTVPNPEPYAVRPGDVLFLGRGHRLYAAVVPEVKPNTIATGYFLILRPDNRLVLPEYLTWSLNQADFQESLRPYHRGSHIPMVSRTDVEALPIALPPLAVQRQIVALHELFDEERRLTATVQEKRSQLLQAVSHKLMHTQPTLKDR